MASTPQLPPLPEVERLSPTCIRILGGNPGKFTLQGTNTYLLGTGRERLLIDTAEGKPSWIASLKRVLSSEPNSPVVSTAIITHWHHDHVGGISDLLSLFPDCKVYKNQPQAEAPRGVKLLPLSDGQTFAVEGATLTAVHTPGHTVDHMALVLHEENAVFTGDNVLGHGTAVFEDLGVYIPSLEKMRTLYKPAGSTGKAYPGHGPVLEDGAAKMAEYVRHRRMREEQVVQTMRAAFTAGMQQEEQNERDGWWTPLELVRIIYRDVPESLHPAAAHGVVQILLKLQREGKVLASSTDGEGRWRLTAAIDRSAL